MNPIDPEIESLSKVVFGKGQDEYLQLPTRTDGHGAVVTCWKLSWYERCVLLLEGELYVTSLTFKMRLQPFKITVDKAEVVRDLQLVLPTVEVQGTKVRVNGEVKIGSEEQVAVQDALDEASENANHESEAN